MPEAFLNLLNRDGTRFLYFYWAEAAKKLPEAQRTDPFGLNYVIRKPGPRPDFILALITLPQPAESGEAYYSALAYRPWRRLLLVSDTTAVFNLEMDEPKRRRRRPAWCSGRGGKSAKWSGAGLKRDWKSFTAMVLNELRE